MSTASATPNRKAVVAQTTSNNSNEDDGRMNRSNSQLSTGSLEHSFDEDSPIARSSTSTMASDSAPVTMDFDSLVAAQSLVVPGSSSRRSSRADAALPDRTLMMLDRDGDEFNILSSSPSTVASGRDGLDVELNMVENVNEFDLTGLDGDAAKIREKLFQAQQELVSMMTFLCCVYCCC